MFSWYILIGWKSPNDLATESTRDFLHSTHLHLQHCIRGRGRGRREGVCFEEEGSYMEVFESQLGVVNRA